jgi:hypothetical protein
MKLLYLIFWLNLGLDPDPDLDLNLQKGQQIHHKLVWICNIGLCSESRSVDPYHSELQTETLHLWTGFGSETLSNESLPEISLLIRWRSISINLKQVIQHVPLVSLIWHDQRSVKRQSVTPQHCQWKCGFVMPVSSYILRLRTSKKIDMHPF